MGHKSIAENIGRSFTDAGLEVRLTDVYKAQEGMLISISAKIHIFMISKAPWLWRFFYKNSLFIKLSMPFRLKIAARNYKETLKIILEFKPDVIITTQTAPSGVVAFLKQQKIFTGQFGIAFSDFHLHKYWLYDQADFYLVNIQEQKQEMLALGVPEQKIFVTGFNLKPAAVINKEVVRGKLNIALESKVILVAAGSLGIGLNYKLLEKLVKQQSWHTIVVCGNNKEVTAKLAERFKQPNISILGFYKPMEELYAIANIFLTKPGGLSVAEALQKHLPMIIVSMLPGQEELNLNFLLKEKLVMPRQKNIIGQIASELENNDFCESLQSNPVLARVVNTPKAASLIRP